MSEFVKLPSGVFFNLDGIKKVYPHPKVDIEERLMEMGIGISWSDGGADTFMYGSDAESMLNYLENHSYIIPEVVSDDECPF